MDNVNDNEFVNNGHVFITSLEQIQHVEKQCISQNIFCNLLGEADMEDDKKDHEVDNFYT